MKQEWRFSTRQLAILCAVSMGFGTSFYRFIMALVDASKNRDALGAALGMASTFVVALSLLSRAEER